jgi:hypothetical protein
VFDLLPEPISPLGAFMVAAAGVMVAFLDRIALLLRPAKRPMA